MKLVIIESPLGTREDGSRCSEAEFKRNQEYVMACMLDSLRRGEAPFASHALYPLVLKDSLPDERRLGMEAGFAYGLAVAEAAKDYRVHRGWCESKEMLAKRNDGLVAHYADRGTTSGMKEGFARHTKNGLSIEVRYLGGEWSKT